MPPDNTFLLAGTYLGEVKMFNLKNGSEESTYHCHDSQVINVQVRENSKKKVSFNIASEASYVYIQSGQKFIGKIPFWQIFPCKNLQNNQ